MLKRVSEKRVFAEDVVIGGKSYVTKSVTDSNVIIAGIPTKIQRTRKKTAKFG